MRTNVTRSLALPLGLLVLACGGSSSVAPPPAAPAPAPASAASASAAPDPLGPRPDPTMPPPYEPASPTVYTTSNGITVWLLERHSLPLVSVSVSVPTGGSSDPKGQAGLAREAADMLDEGAGKRGALEFAKAVEDLGASLVSGAGADQSYVQLDVTKRSFAAAMQLLGDAVVRPRFEDREWKRVHDLWTNMLTQRQAQPRDVARVVAMSTLYGVDHPYGHPMEGLVSSAPKVTLAAAKKFRDAAWRPDRTVVVAVGDVTKAELDAQLDAAFGKWTAPTTPAPPVLTPPPPPEGASRPKLIMVDRPDASQSVVFLVRPGVSASDPREPALERVNIALGGSFDSRLMQDLREKHGWTYGAGSSVQVMRGVGSIAAGGSFVTDKTADAVKGLLADVDDFAQKGITEEESEKTRKKTRADLVEEYETVEHTCLALAHDASLGLGPDWEAKSASLADHADRKALNDLAATFFDRASASVVVVGSRAKLEASLSEVGLGSITFVDAEGNPASSKAPVTAKAPPAPAKPAGAASPGAGKAQGKP